MYQGPAWLIIGCIPESGDNQHSKPISLIFTPQPSCQAACSISWSNSMASRKAMSQWGFQGPCPCAFGTWIVLTETSLKILGWGKKTVWVLLYVQQKDTCAAFLKCSRTKWWNFQISFYEARITVIPKSDKGGGKRKNHSHLWININGKSLNKITLNRICQ